VKKTMPRAPKKKTKLQFAGEVLGNFLVVNVIVFGALISFPTHTAGAAASAHLDPATGKPVLLELQGCEVVPSSEVLQKEDGR
jgi:hypothetical protein